MNPYKSEITGTTHMLATIAKKVHLAIQEGWAEQDCMLTPIQVRNAGADMSEAVKLIKAAQKDFARFEAVAEARKLETV